MTSGTEGVVVGEGKRVAGKKRKKGKLGKKITISVRAGQKRAEFSFGTERVREQHKSRG